RRIAPTVAGTTRGKLRQRALSIAEVSPDLERGLAEPSRNSRLCAERSKITTHVSSSLVARDHVKPVRYRLPTKLARFRQQFFFQATSPRFARSVQSDNHSDLYSDL